MTDLQKYNVQLFDGTDWTKWSDQIKLVLQLKHLWKYVKEPLARPAPDTAVAIRTKYDDEMEETRAMLLLALDHKRRETVKQLETPHEIWAELVGTFQGKGAYTIITLSCELFEKRYMDGEFMEDYVASFEVVNHRLKEFGADIPDKTLAALLLSSLPPSYSAFVTSIETTENTTNPISME